MSRLERLYSCKLVSLVVASCALFALTSLLVLAQIAAPAAALLANFPLPAGAVRKSFTSNRHIDSWQERGVFTAAASVDKVANDYARQITAAGWSAGFTSSTGTLAAGSLRVVQDYTLGQSKGHIVVGVDPRGASVDITLTTVFPAARPVLAVDVNATPSIGPTSSSSDQGVADPANFPRLPGTVRSSYQVSVADNTRRETATYVASGGVDGGEAFFRQGLSQTQWNETYRYIEIDDATHATKIQNTWETAGRNASMTLTSAANGSSTLLVAVTSSGLTAPTTSTVLTPKTISPPSVPSTGAAASTTTGGTGVVAPTVIPPTTSPGSLPAGTNVAARVTAISRFGVEYAGPASFRLRWSCDDDAACWSAIFGFDPAGQGAGAGIPPNPPPPPESSIRPYTYEIYKKSATDSKFSLLATTNAVNIYCSQSHVADILRDGPDPAASTGGGSNADFCGVSAPVTSSTICDGLAAEWSGILASAVAAPATFRIVRRDPSGKLVGTHADFNYGPLRLSPK